MLKSMPTTRPPDSLTSSLRLGDLPLLVRASERTPSNRYFVDRLGRTIVAGHHVFRICRESVFVNIQTLDLALGRDSQSKRVLDAVHQDHRHDEGRDRDREAPD